VEPTCPTAQAVSQQRDGGQESGAGSEQEPIHQRRLLQRKLLIQATVPTLIGVVQLIFAIVAIGSGDAPVKVLQWALPALLVGYLFGCMVKIAWDDEKAQVALIRAQLVLTLTYVMVRVGAHFALEWTLGGRVCVADVLLLVSFGLFVGRTVGIAGQIWQVLSRRSSHDSPRSLPREDAEGWRQRAFNRGT
jgi:hypothetical protein